MHSFVRWLKNRKFNSLYYTPKVDRLFRSHYIFPRRSKHASMILGIFQHGIRNWQNGVQWMLGFDIFDTFKAIEYFLNFQNNKTMLVSFARRKKSKRENKIETVAVTLNSKYLKRNQLSTNQSQPQPLLHP